MLSLEHEIRCWVMGGKSDIVRMLLLTTNQIELIKKVGRMDLFTASQLSESEGLSIQHASSKLNRLYQGGYLERLTTSSKSGGIEYVYRAQNYGQIS